MCCRQCVSNRVPWKSTVRQFIWERLFENTNYIIEVVKLNNIHLFNAPHKRQRTNTSGLVLSLKSQTATFSRDCMLHLSFVMGTSMNFSHKNQLCPPSLSVRGKLKLGIKSDIVRCLEDAQEEQDDTSVDVVVVLHGLAILYVLKPAAAGTFCESYVRDVFQPYV